MQDLLAVGDQPCSRADGDAGGEIAEDGAKSDALEQRRRDDRAAEQQQDFGEDRDWRCHAAISLVLGRVDSAGGTQNRCGRPLTHCTSAQ